MNANRTRERNGAGGGKAPRYAVGDVVALTRAVRLEVDGRAFTALAGSEWRVLAIEIDGPRRKPRYRLASSLCRTIKTEGRIRCLVRSERSQPRPK